MSAPTLGSVTRHLKAKALGTMLGKPVSIHMPHLLKCPSAEVKGIVQKLRFLEDIGGARLN